MPDTPSAAAPAQRALLWRLLPLSLAEWRHHPWRHGVALLAVALGVALASSVQVINASALAEFGQAVRSVNGTPDLVLSATDRAGFDDALYARLAQDPAVALASPVLELDAPVQWPNQAASTALRTPAVKLLGVDLLKVAALAPDLMPQLGQADAEAQPGPPTQTPTQPPAPGSTASAQAANGPAQPATSAGGRGPLALLLPDQVYLNPAARRQLGARLGQTLRLGSAQGWQEFTVAGWVSAPGSPLVVLDIGAAQTRFQQLGRLSRVDLRLVAGTDQAAWQAQALGGPLPPAVRWAAAQDAQARVSNLSRAYRVNLGVLAMVALLVGGFLVYSVVSLSVAQRLPQFALLGVLGLAAAERRRLVVAESLVLGLLGSALGLAAGAALAAAALHLMGADLGGGYFAGVAPALHWPWGALATCGALGTAATVLGAWWPARQAERLQPAQALKGLGQVAAAPARWWPGLALLGSGALLALAPPVAGLPLAAYAAVALLLAGGVALVPAVVQAVLSLPLALPDALPLLAWRRAHFARATAAATVAGVVASLALSVAITVMVVSFRSAVTDWLDSVLPADLYVRTAGGGSTPLPPGLAASVAALPGVLRAEPGRQRQIVVAPDQPALALLARDLGEDPARSLPLLAPPLPAQADLTGAWVTEPAAALYGWQAGQVLRLPLAGAPDGLLTVQVRGIWRDYARQFGAVLLDLRDYRRLTGDTQANDLALWLAPGQALAPVEAALQGLASGHTALETIGTQALRQVSLQIFDRSFAVTYYLQAVAIAVGLVGVAASLSAQVLARRKEFGLLAHLGLTRRQTTTLVVAETAAWLVCGTLIGVLLGLAMAVVLVHVVNPQSFHWSMPLQVPSGRLAALAGAVLGAGLLTAAWSARRAAGQDAVQAVKEDW